MLPTKRSTRGNPYPDGGNCQPRRWHAGDPRPAGSRLLEKSPFSRSGHEVRSFRPAGRTFSGRRTNPRPRRRNFQTEVQSAGGHTHAVSSEPMRLRKAPRFLVLTLGYTALVQAAYVASL